MNLNEAQRQQVAAWVAAGLKLSEIQNRLAAELGVKLTYMEARFLVDDLKLKLKDPEPPKPATPAAAPATNAKSPDAPGATLPGLGTTSGVPSSVSVTVDKVMRTGALVSGQVTFSDAATAEWYLDQTGRLGVIPKQPGYKPSAADVQQFQMALEGELAKAGFA